MQRRPTTVLFMGLLGLLMSASAVSHAAFSRTGDAQISFTALGPAGMKIIGTTSELSVSEANQELVVVVPLRNLDTKISLRNKHMREKYLEVDKYPNAELRVRRSALRIPSGAPVSAKAEGTLTLHGRSKVTPFTYVAKTEGDRIAVSGELHVNMTDFGIAQPGYSGISVKPDVDVQVSFHVQDQ
jgi:polyisoprenoid-binding protein YceI